MPSVLLVTFCLQLLIHALNTLFPQTITEFLWSFYTGLPTPQGSDAQETVRLKKDVVRLHREMSATSAQDDFAKWARLRREHDKAKAKYEEKAKGIQNFRATFDKSISALRWLGTQGLQFQCLLQQAADVLPPPVLGTLPGRMGAQFPSCANWQHFCQYLGNRLRMCYRAGF